MAKMTPELRFLLSAVRAVRGGTDVIALRNAAVAGLDWAAIVEGIGRHGLHRLAAPLLATLELPPAIATDLRQRTAVQAIETLQRVEETVRVSAALAQRGIRFLMVKGVPLSVQLYGDATRRPARDIDVVVERRRAGEAGAILAGLGYILPGAQNVAAAGAAAAPTAVVAKETGYVHQRSRILVEIHDRLTDNDALLPWDFEMLWAEREHVTVGGCQIPTMARHRLPLYLCVHGAKHCWARLLWLDDLAALLDSPAAIDRALADAAGQRMRALMLHALATLHDWFGHPVPAPILAQARASRHVRLLDTIVARFHAHAHWHQQPGRHSWRRFWQGSVQARLFGYAMRPDPRYWRRQLRLELISPADRALVDLPASLNWLYVPLRPVGWLIRRIGVARSGWRS